MRIGNTGLPETVSTGPVQETSRVQAPSSPTSSSATQGGGTLQSSVMGPAMQALANMPEIDLAKVAAVRDALAKGEITFDAGKLAGLIARYHGGQG